MKKDQLAFLVGGFVFGTLFGLAVFNAWFARPTSATAGAGDDAMGPRGPAAATQTQARPGPQAPASSQGGGAPMIAEINSLKQRLQQNPSDVEAFARLANIYHDAGMYDQAIGFYEKALVLAPGNPDLTTDMGICYEQLGQLPKALSLFEESHRTHPTHWQSLYNIVVVHAQMGHANEAGEALTRLEKLNPATPNLDALRNLVAQARAAGGKS